MRAHTRKRPTSSKSKKGDDIDYLDSEKVIKDAEKDFNLPRWAIYLSGLRGREDLTQKQLGEIIGVKQSNISEMERGIRPIGKNIAQRLAKAFKTDYRLFL